MTQNDEQKSIVPSTTPGSATKRARSCKKPASASTKKSNTKKPSKPDSESIAKLFSAATNKSKRAILDEKPSEKCETVAEKPLLTAAEIKEKLKNCKNLAKLKEQLSAINGCADKVKQFKEIKVCLSPVKPSYQKSPKKIYSPEKFSVSGLTLIPSPLRACKPSPRSPLVLNSSSKYHSPRLSNLASETKFQPSCTRRLFDDATDDQKNQTSSDKEISSPAYKRFNYLSSRTADNVDVESSDQLPLPMHFRKYLELFKRMDYFSWVYYKRQEVCTFDKLKRSIEQSTHRSFDMNLLLKVLSVGGKDRWFRLSYELVSSSRKLVISPNYSNHDIDIKMNSFSHLLDREKEFHLALLTVVKNEHKNFLEEMKIDLAADKHIFRWHPMFKLDKVVDIKPDKSLLPSSLVVTGANKTSDKSSILHYCVSKKQLVKNDPDSVDKTSKSEDSPGLESKKESPKVIKKGLLKGISMDLLNKVSFLALLLFQV